MKKFYRLVLILPMVLLSCTEKEESTLETPQPIVVVFPGAEGGAAYATGGRGKYVIPVTTLEDNDPGINEPLIPGSIRAAISQSEGGIIVFEVSGIIHLKKPLEIKNKNITIFGQSAPGDGICIADYPIVIKKAENIVIQFIRLRMGDKSKSEYDALSVNDSKNILIDHCSFSWSTDECVSCYGNENFTLQYCFITESLRNSVHSKKEHGYGGIWGGTNATFHHNLLAHHDSRNPRFDHDYVVASRRGPLDFVNNVVYNWGSNSAYGGESVSDARKINFVGNYYKPGPATKSGVTTRLLNATTYCTNCVKNTGKVKPGSFYLADNYMYGSTAVTNDNWSGVVLDSKGSAKLADCKSSTPHTMSYEMQIQTAEQAFETVLAKAGCSLVRDIIDERIVNEVRNGTYTYKGSNGSTGGLIDSQSDVGGWPEYKGTLATDSDRDGIPDEWEISHGLDPNKYSDAVLNTLDENYTNIEVYLNSLVEHLY